MAAARNVPQVGVAFLLSQVGTHAAYGFEERLGAALGLKPHHAGLLRMLGSNPGSSQQELSELLGVFPSRLVVLLDDLETQALVERRDDPADRRGYRVHLTSAGQKALAEVGRLTRDLEQDLLTSLTSPERETLMGLLQRIVSQQNITPAAHPAYRKLRDDKVPSKPKRAGTTSRKRA